MAIAIVKRNLLACFMGFAVLSIFNVNYSHAKTPPIEKNPVFKKICN